MHTRWDSPGRLISLTQRPLPDNTQHLQETYFHAPAGDSNPQFQQASGRSPTLDRVVTGIGLVQYETASLRIHMNPKCGVVHVTGCHSLFTLTNSLVECDRYVGVITLVKTEPISDSILKRQANCIHCGKVQRQLEIQWVKRSKSTFRELIDDRLRNESPSDTNVDDDDDNNSNNA